MKYHAYFGIILMLTKWFESLSKNYYKVRWNYYKLRQLSLLQSTMDCYYKLRQLFYYKVRRGLLQIATGITKCDDYYKLRQYNQSPCPRSLARVISSCFAKRCFPKHGFSLLDVSLSEEKLTHFLCNDFPSFSRRRNG